MQISLVQFEFYVNRNMLLDWIGSSPFMVELSSGPAE